MEETITNTPEEQLQWMESKFKEVKKTVEKLEDFLNKFEIIRDKLDDDEDGLETNLERAKSKKEEINKLHTEATQTLEKIKDEISVKTNDLNTVEQLLKSFRTNIDESQSIRNEIGKLKSESTNDRDSIGKILSKIQSNSDTIDGLLNEAQTNVTNINDFLSTFNNLKGQIEDEENGFENTIGIVNENLIKSNELLETIKRTRNDSNKHLVEIENEKESIKGISEEIKVIRTDSKKDFEEIKKYLNIATDGSFAQSFNMRKQEHKKSAKNWMQILIGSTIVLIGYLIIVFWNNIFGDAGIPATDSSIFRLTVSSPILFLIYFSGSEYSKSKKNEEKYAFKFATSSVFRNHIKFMLEKFGEDKKGEVLETTQNIIDMLYTPTYPSEDKISKTEKEILENYTNNKKGKKISQQSFDDTINRIKKIKDIGIDPEIIKIIIPLLFK